MEIEWDQAKSDANRAKHGLGFEEFEGFDAAPAIIADTRFDYREPRFRAFGRINSQPHSIAYAMRGEAMRLISFRRAHEKEMRRYE